MSKWTIEHSKKENETAFIRVKNETEKKEKQNIYYIVNYVPIIKGV